MRKPYVREAPGEAGGSELALQVNSEMERGQVTQTESGVRAILTFNRYVSASVICQGTVKDMNGIGGKVNEVQKK